MTEIDEWTCHHCGALCSYDEPDTDHQCVGLSWRKLLSIWSDHEWQRIRFHAKRLRCRLLDHRFVAYPVMNISLPDGRTFIKPGRACDRCDITFYDPPIWGAHMQEASPHEPTRHHPV